MDRPNCSHPSLTPLTTLPTSPHPSPSYLYPTTSIPPTPSLLSRPSSQTRLRPVRSALTAVLPTSTSLSSPFPLQNPLPQKKKRKKRNRTIRNDSTEDDWITRTASTLTLSRLEEKGQSWLVARKSSTSLTGAGEGEDDDDDDDDDGGGGGGDYAYSQEWNWERARSMRGSGAMLQGQSRGQSRSGSIGGGGGRVGQEEEGEERGEEEIRPDFVDVEEGEEEGEEVDEGEMKRVVMGRVGGWVDWAVGWMDFRGEGEEEGDVDEAEADRDANEEDGEAVTKGELDLVELQKRLRKKKRKDDEAETGGEGIKTMSSAPEQAGVWSDAKWLLGVATKVAYE